MLLKVFSFSEIEKELNSSSRIISNILAGWKTVLENLSASFTEKKKPPQPTMMNRTI